MKHILRRFLPAVLLVLTGTIAMAGNPFYSNRPPMLCLSTGFCTTCPVAGIANGCIFVSLDLGETTPWTGSIPVFLRIHTIEESPSLSTPSPLKVVMGYTFKNVGDGTTRDGAPAVVRFVDPDGTELVVDFKDGESLGVPRPTVSGKSIARVRMVDAEGWAALSNPAYYDLYPGDGSVWRFLAAGATNERGALVSCTDPRGRVLAMDDFGVDIVHDVLGNVRQVKTLTRLADVQTLSPTHYAVTVYPLAEEPELVAGTGLYALPEHAPVRVLDVARGESVKELLVGLKKGTGDVRQYRFVAANGDWTLEKPDGLRDSKELYYSEDESGARRIQTVRGPDGTLLSRTEANYVSAFWAYLPTNLVEGVPGDATRATSWSYYTDGPHKDLLRETVEPNGNRIVYEYDAQNRVVRESMPLVEEETLYSYEPVDPSDPPLLCDTRPRCVVKKMQGVEIRRTYYVYGTNGVDVIERVGEQGAAYGGTNVLRTVTTYYPVTGAVTDGLVQSVRHEDGTVDDYAYDLTDGVWTETITHVHEQTPDIVPMRTTRSVRVYNALGRLVDLRTDLCTIGVEDLVPQADWTPIERLQYAYDADGNEIRREDLAGRLWTAEWAGNCCGKVSETDWQGITTTYAYDQDGRIVTKTSRIPFDVDTWFVYDSLGRIVQTWTTNSSANVGISPTFTVFDSLERSIQKTDEWGNATKYDYPNSHTIVMQLATGVFQTNEFVNGRLVTSFGTALPPRRYTYAIDYLGRPIATEYSGSGSNCWESVSIDMFGRLVERIHPYDATNTWMNQGRVHHYTSYDNGGRIVGQTVEFERNDGSRETLSQNGYKYDLEGNLLLSYSKGSFEANQQGVITVAEFEPIGHDRGETTTIRYCVRESAIWKEKTKGVFSDSDSETIRTNSVEQIQITGLMFGSARVRTRDSLGMWEEWTRTVDREKGERTETSTSFGKRMPVTLVWKYGNISEQTRKDGLTVFYSRDELGRIVSWSNSLGRVHCFRYGRHNEIIEEADDESGIVQYCYDSNGRRTRAIDALGRTQFYSRDSLGRVVGTWGSVHPQWFSYDENGHLVAKGKTRQVGITPETVPDAFSPQIETWKFLYSNAGIVSARQTETNGIWISWHPDGRVWGIGSETGTGSPSWKKRGVEFENDSLGNRLVENQDVVIDREGPASPWDAAQYFFLRDRTGVPTCIISASDSRSFYQRNGMGFVTNEIQQAEIRFDESGNIIETRDGVSIQYWYDSFGHMSGYTFPGETNVVFEYDQFGRQSALRIGSVSFAFEYTPGIARPSSIRHNAGVQQREGFMNHQRELRLFDSSGNVIGFVRERSDVLGKINERSETGWNCPDVHSSIERNGTGEVSSVTKTTVEDSSVFQYAYDCSGNRVSSFEAGRLQIYEPNAFDEQAQLVDSDGTLTIDFDYSGNQKHVKTVTGIWNVWYDEHNRAAMVTNESDCILYRFDHEGKPIKRVSSSVTNRFYYIEGNLAMVSSNGVPVVRYYWEPGPAGAVGLLAYACDGDFRVVQTDWNCNPIGWVSLKTANVGRLSYLPFGEEEAGEFPPWIGWSSQFVDRDTGLVYFRRRSYNPRDGRWLSRDPLPWIQLNPALPNDYLYIDNDPYSGFDYFGLLRFKGDCSVEQQNKLNNAMDSLCNETQNNETACCFTERNGNTPENPNGLLHSHDVIRGLRDKCDKTRIALQYVGCSSEDDCLLAQYSKGVRPFSCGGFVCLSGSEQTSLCSNKDRQVPYFCPNAFSGDCQGNVGCLLFEGFSLEILRATSEEEAKQSIVNMKPCLKACTNTSN